MLGLETLQGIVPIFFCPLPKLSSSFPATQNALFLSFFRSTRKPELDREGKGNLDDTGLELPVYRGNQVIFYLVDRTVTANPLNKSPFPGQYGAGLSVPAARHSAPTGHLGTTAVPCVLRLARRGGTSPGRGSPCSAAFLSHFPQGDSGSPGTEQIVPDCVCRPVGHLSAPGSARRAHLQPPPPALEKLDRGAAVRVRVRRPPPRPAEDCRAPWAPLPGRDQEARANAVS